MDTSAWDDVLTALEKDPNDGRAIGELLHAITAEESPEPLIQSVLDLALRTRRGADLLSVVAHQCFRQGDYTGSENAWRCYLELRSNDANARFNHALALRHAGQLDSALKCFSELAASGAVARADCWVNCGNIHRELRRYDQAMNAYEEALRVHHDHSLAMLNLAMVCEEMGDRSRAKELYSALLQNDPRHAVALTNMAYMQRFTSKQDPLLKRLQRCARYADQSFDDALVHFALGKALDDLEDFGNAFYSYQQANHIAARNDDLFDADDFTQAVERAMESTSAVDATSSRRCVFICGMYRSGSTLLEHVLGAHKKLVPGGELAFFSSGLAEDCRDAEDYIEHISERFPDEKRIVIDKSPDNLFHVRRILSLFPNARILITERHPLDVVLSNYFQPFAPGRSWSTDLDHLVHAYRESRRLTRHWLESFPENVLTVRYESLVEDVESTLRQCLEFLDLEWDPACLRFSESENPVNTGSIWQVREPLYQRSIGRWRNYQGELKTVAEDLCREIQEYEVRSLVT